MAANTKEVRVGGTGRVLVAPANTPVPDATGDLPPVWSDLGLTNEEGVTFTKADSLEAVQSWQHTAPVRLAYSEREFTVTFALLQINRDTLSFFFGDPGASTENGTTRASLSAAPQPDERALLVEFSDGGVLSRFVIPRGMVTESEDVQITRSAAVQLNVTFQAIAPSENPHDMVVWLTHDAGQDGGEEEPAAPPAPAAT
ncbi:phage tail tube protein [Nocardiopsis alborubida]